MRKRKMMSITMAAIMFCSLFGMNVNAQEKVSDTNVGVKEQEQIEESMMCEMENQQVAFGKATIKLKVGMA